MASFDMLSSLLQGVLQMFDRLVKARSNFLRGRQNLGFACAAFFKKIDLFF